jgi:uncharacterized protein (TIGR03086 family)
MASPDAPHLADPTDLPNQADRPGPADGTGLADGTRPDGEGSGHADRVVPGGAGADPVAALLAAGREAEAARVGALATAPTAPTSPTTKPSPSPSPSAATSPTAATSSSASAWASRTASRSASPNPSRGTQPIQPTERTQPIQASPSAPAGPSDPSSPPSEPTTGDPMEPLAQLDQLAPLLGGVVGGITPDQLDRPTPCREFTVRGVLEHMVGGAAAFAAAYRGVPAGEPDVSDPLAAFGPALTELGAAISAPGALDQTITSPFGELPGETFARFVVFDGLVHGWDMATATGQVYAPSDELVAEVESFARQVLDPLRDGQTFAAEVAPAPDATPIERLAAYTGRRPVT